MVPAAAAAAFGELIGRSHARKLAAPGQGAAAVDLQLARLVGRAGVSARGAGRPARG